MFRVSLIVFIASALGFLCLDASASPHRGVWFWNTTKVDGSDSPHSSKFVVGPTSGAAEDEAIAFMTSQGIKEVYGSYLHRPRDVPEEIWPWNAKLDAAGIESQLLISGFEAADPLPLTDPTHTSLLTKVTDRLIDFNDDAPSTAAQFDALHLDLEPQTLDAWSSGTGADKRAFLDDLLDAYLDIRNALDTAGYGTLPMYADIPFTWNKIPGSIAWASPADRDGWFNDVLSVVDGLTIMTFSKDNFPDLQVATDYERTMGGSAVHVGIQPKVGPGEIWPTYADFKSATIDLETHHNEAHIENYAFWRHAFSDYGSVAPHRGVWFWNTTTVDGTTSPHSSSEVVGVAAAEDEAIAFMNGKDINEIYGSYGTRPETVPTEIWPWNEKLDAAGIESQLLISGFDPADTASLTDPDHLGLVTKVTERLIDFNDTAPSAAAEFDALHLDLEPQALSDWSSGTSADKRVFLDHLLDAYVDIRAALDAGGYAGLPIYADIPFTWDKIPGSIAWASEADRDGWFASLATVLDGLSIMTFSKGNLCDLATATVYERTGPFIAGGGTVHVAIQPKVGPGEIWPTYPVFQMVKEGLECAYGEVHLENYAFWRHAYADFGPSIGSLPGLESFPELVADSSSGGVIILTGVPGYLYTVRHSTHPGRGWKDIAQLTTQGQQRKESLNLPVDYGSQTRGFWTITETPLPSRYPGRVYFLLTNLISMNFVNPSFSLFGTDSVSKRSSALFWVTDVFCTTGEPSGFFTFVVQ